MVLRFRPRSLVSVARDVGPLRWTRVSRRPMLLRLSSSGRSVPAGRHLAPGASECAARGHVVVSPHGRSERGAPVCVPSVCCGAQLWEPWRRSIRAGGRPSPSRSRRRVATPGPAEAVGPVRAPKGPAAQVRLQPSPRCSSPAHDLRDDLRARRERPAGTPALARASSKRWVVDDAPSARSKTSKVGRDGVVVVGPVGPAAHGDHRSGTHEQRQGVHAVPLPHPARTLDRPARRAAPPSGRAGT